MNNMANGGQFSISRLRGGAISWAILIFLLMIKQLKSILYIKKLGKLSDDKITEIFIQKKLEIPSLLTSVKTTEIFIKKTLKSLKSFVSLLMTKQLESLFEKT